MCILFVDGFEDFALWLKHLKVLVCFVDDLISILLISIMQIINVIFHLLEGLELLHVVHLHSDCVAGFARENLAMRPTNLSRLIILSQVLIKEINLSLRRWMQTLQGLLHIFYLLYLWWGDVARICAQILHKSLKVGQLLHRLINLGLLIHLVHGAQDRHWFVTDFCRRHCRHLFSFAALSLNIIRLLLHSLLILKYRLKLRLQLLVIL